MDDEYDIVNASLKVFSGVLPLSTTMRHHVGFPVEAHKNRYNPTFRMPSHGKEDIIDVEWRCPGTGPYPRTDNMAQLPPLNEIMADSLKWDPIGARWGRGAHWPLVLGIGKHRDRTPARAPLRWREVNPIHRKVDFHRVRGNNTLPGGQAQLVRAPGHQHHGPGDDRVMHGVLHLKHNHRALMDCTRCWISHCLQTNQNNSLHVHLLKLISFI